MKTVAMLQVRQKLSELVGRASEGEQIGITRRGRLVAVVGPAPAALSVAQVFADIDKIRKRVRPLRGVTIKALIEEGRG